MSLLIPGSETLVNTTTTGEQSYPAVTALTDGGYVVTWTSFGQDGSGSGIYAQRYDADGNAVGSETRVNTTTAGEPAVAALSDGGYVVTWHGPDNPSGSNGIYAQRYDAGGDAVGSETLVNTMTAGAQHSPAVAALSDGGYVVTWMSGYAQEDGWGIYAQRYDADGNAVGSETGVNTTTYANQLSPAVAALSDGGYVVTWYSNYGNRIDAQRYDTDGNAVGSETRVNTTTALSQLSPAVTALTDGGYVVTWTSSGQDGSSYGIYAQRYDAGGNAVGSETRVNTTTANGQVYPGAANPAVAALSDGGYVVTWMSYDQDGSDYGIYAQRYDAAGNAVGPETGVNTTTVGEQSYPAVAALSDGGYVVTWMSNGDGSGYGIYSRTFTEVDEGPSLLISSSDADGVLRKGETTTLTFDFSEGVTGFSAADISISPKLGTLGPLVQDNADPTLYRATFTPSKNGSGAISIDVSNDYSDAAGNIGDSAGLTLYVNTLNSTGGTNANNNLSGTGKADLLDGAAGNDTLKGNGGNDWLLGGTGDDRLDGGAGADVLIGQAGDDQLTGGAGADHFVYNQIGFGADTIVDFNETQGDKIDLRGLDLSYDDLVFSQSGANAAVAIGSDTIIVANTQATDLDAGYFIL